MTPPATLLYVRKGNRISKQKDADGKRRSDWSVRCIPNLYPAVSLPGCETLGVAEELGSTYVKRHAKGVHEIIVESPRHDDHPNRASQEQIQLWLQAAMERVQSLSRNESIGSISIFRNHGHEAGASLAHAHLQIIATQLIPTRLEDENRAMKKFHREFGDCLLCKVIVKESKSDRRILNTQNFTVFAPWASVFPFEFWVVPRRHSASILGLSQEEVVDLARAIRLSFAGLAKTVSDPPYNSIFHIGPTKARDGAFHWHIEVYPKLSVQAGFELGTGMYINTLRPEAAAHALASAVKQQARKLN
jgi:UDPglucose--hexose-1-phosphate uridylyltransferase